MAQLTVRNVDDQVLRAAAHREILRRALLEDGKAKESFAEQAARLRRRLRSDVDSAELIRADRDPST